MKNEERKIAICRILESGKILTIPEMIQQTGISSSSLRDSLNDLVREKQVVRCGYQNGRKLYRIQKEWEMAPCCHCAADRKATSKGIWPEEMNSVKQWAKPGTNIRIWNPCSTTDDEESQVVKTKIKAVYPYIVVMENGLSATWAQMAVYCRNKKYGYIR